MSTQDQSRRYAVTGCASGIGAALVRSLKSDGHEVVGFDIHPCEEVDYFIPLDLGNDATIVSAVSQADGTFDGVCNVAGLPPRNQEGWAERLLQVNFLAQRRFTHAILPKLTAGSSIVNLASRAGQNWRENLDQNRKLGAMRSGDDLSEFVKVNEIDSTRAYNLSKEAMILWSMADTESLIARNVRINSISPGAIATGILDDFKRAFGDRVTRNVERTGRPGTPEEVAEVAAFLLSPISGWINGSDIPVDGGMGGFNASDALGLEGMGIGLLR